MAIQDLSTLATLKGWLPITSTNSADDITISRLLTAVSMDFMRATRRPDLLQSTYTEVHQGDGSSRMIAYHWPITTVTSLVVGAATVAASADKVANGYYFDADIDPERMWNLYLIGSSFTDGAPVKLAYTAGYVQPGVIPTGSQILLPEDIEQAICDWCTYRYKERPNVSFKQIKSSSGEQSNSELIDAPPNVLQVIERYKRQVPCIDRRAEDRAERMARPSFKRK